MILACTPAMAFNCVPPRPFTTTLPATRVTMPFLMSIIGFGRFDAVVWRHQCSDGRVQAMLTILPTNGTAGVSSLSWSISQGAGASQGALLWGERLGQVVSIDYEAISLPKTYMLDSMRNTFDPSAAFQLTYLEQSPHVIASVPATSAPGQSPTLVVSVAGAGVVTSIPTGINCPGTCTGSYPSNMNVSLNASALPGSVFIGWTGACTNATTTCSLAMTGDRQVTANFQSQSGSGSTSTLTNGIPVRSSTHSTIGNGDYRDFLVQVPSGASNLLIQTLNATGDVDLYVRFGGWPSLNTFDCRPYLVGGNEACGAANPAPGTQYIRVYGFQTGTVSFDVLATWQLSQNSLMVSRMGSGNGSVVSQPSGIDCGSSCAATFAAGTTVTLTALASPGSVFVGWGGACSGNAGCAFVMNGTQLVSAEFREISNPGLDEPRALGFSLPVPNPPNQNCPGGFFVAAVEDGAGSGLQAGIFGLEVLLEGSGSRLLNGGLNFGGLVDMGQAGFAGFNIANPANELQRVDLEIIGSTLFGQNTFLPVRMKIEQQTASGNQVVYFWEGNISMNIPVRGSVTLLPGFYVASVAPLTGMSGGTADGQFFLSMTTRFLDRLGGGFQGGAVVGGYHAQHPQGGVSGFAGFCTGGPHTASFRTYAAPTYGVSGARDLRLRVVDDRQNHIIVQPPATVAN